MHPLLLLPLPLLTLAQNLPPPDPATHNLHLVNPLIGTYNGGNAFAGATLPFGLAKAVADVSGQNTAGFSPDASNVTGFSALHDSGTGGQPSMGNFPLSVQPRCAGDVVDGCRFGSKYARAVDYVNGTVVAEPGYFALGLEGGVAFETTVTEHAALYRFRFAGAGGAVSPMFLLDLTDLQDSRQNASVSVDPRTGRISGNGTFLPSFGVGSYQAYFCVDFQGASVRDTGVWVNERAGTEPKELFVNRGYSLFYIQAGGFVRFGNPSNGTIYARVGLSFISTAQACHNAEREIPDYDFARLRQSATDTWRSKLTNISIVPGNASLDLQQTFFSAIYRTLISPQNYTHENPLWPQTTEPYFDSFYCIWDSFRTTFPFLAVVDPTTLAQLLRSLLDTYAHLGWLPDCRMQFCKGYTQGGSNADVVLADALLKNVTGGVDWPLAYQAVVNDAENEPFDWGVEGRGGLQSWKRLGYIPVLDYDYLGFGPDFHSISRTLEYAYDDFAVAQMAHRLGHTADAAKYLARSDNWRRLYKADQTSFWPNGTDTGFTGFFQPRYANGTWRFQDPMECSPLDGFCSYSSNPKETFESSIWEYQFYVPQNMAEVVRVLGGREEFVRRLDFLHESGLLDIGNEPSELACYLYHYAGRPGRSAYRIRTYVPALFHASVDGLPGNDDSGASGSFLAFAMAGLFPVAGQDVYLISPPFFEEVAFTSPVTGRVARIRKEGQGVYVQSARLDGEVYARSWIGHGFFLGGGTLVLEMGSEESEWGTREEDLPPSAGAEGAGQDGM
ncbi:glycoside hydrolase family 92 protein [Teratosphaeria destructans]|uniref:Glycoside hydrolase family 92 protein n=1 Tax=Teratosphaeria destructans TaxID=418781 RepID=A0A9W7W2G0_9PEZI|nr:glycoside hydrolase family 92 protein [Teratosphaeria destructans]